MHRIPLSYPIFSGLPVCRQHSPLYDAFSLFYTRSVLSPLYAFSSLFSCRFPCPALQRPAGYYFPQRYPAVPILPMPAAPRVRRKIFLSVVERIFRFILVRLSLPPSRGRKIIPEAANRPNKGKQTKQTRLNYEL